MRETDQAILGQSQDPVPVEVLQSLRKAARGNPIRQRWETAVQLHDGTWVGSWSEDWRLECEARHLLRMPLAKRREDLEAVERLRGIKATLKLKDRMLAIHRVAKESTPA